MRTRFHRYLLLLTLVGLTPFLSACGLLRQSRSAAAGANQAPCRQRPREREGTIPASAAGAEAPPAQQPAATAQQAVERFAVSYINWTYKSLAADEARLAASAVGEARAAELQAQAQAARDTPLQRAHIYNTGTVGLGQPRRRRAARGMGDRHARADRRGSGIRGHPDGLPRHPRDGGAGEQRICGECVATPGVGEVLGIASDARADRGNQLQRAIHLAHLAAIVAAATSRERRRALRRRPVLPSGARLLLAVAGLSGGAGASVLAYLIAVTAARESSVPVLVVDTGGPTAGLASHAGQRPADARRYRRADRRRGASDGSVVG